MNIPVNEIRFGGRELEYVSECIETGWVSSAGRFIDEFEIEWAKFCDRKYGIAVNNGTVALQLAVSCLDLNPGDEIIMPALTIISCPLAAIYNDLRPVLIDVDPDTWCMDVSLLETAITPNTRAIMPVHLYGHPVEMDPLIKIAKKHGLRIIEDAAEAHGAQYYSKFLNRKQSSWHRCGGFGEMSVFSFYANKPVTTGEGGMVLTDDRSLAEMLRARRNLCFGKINRFVHDETGFNFRMTNLQAALGLAQIEKIEEIIEKKRWIGSKYNERFQNVSGITIPAEKPWAKNIYWMYGILISNEKGLNAEKLSNLLLDEGIETRPFFECIHKQPAFLKKGLFINEHYPVAENLARQGLYLPSGLTINEEQIDHISKSVINILKTL